MRKFALFIASMVFAPTSGFTAPPKLVVAISVDQFAADLFDQYRAQFTGGLARLASGTVFRNGYQSHAATSTCPGHATILTGVRPARSGIIANEWFDQSVARDDKHIYCAEEERIQGTSSSKYIVSPVHLRSTTLGERMKARWPASRNVAVAGKDRSAVMMSGHRAEQRWYWDNGAFVSDISTSAAAPRSVTRTNAAVRSALRTARAPMESPPFCQARSGEVAIEGRDKPVGSGRFDRIAGDQSSFRESPEFDAAVLALAASLVQEMKLGRRAAPDLLSIGLSATDSVGHKYGPGGQEMCLQLLSLDRDLDGFFKVLDAEKVDYAVVLTADHGIQDIPERLRQKGVEAARVSADLHASAIGKALAARLGLKGPLLHGGYSGDIHLDQALKGNSRERVLREALAAYRAHPQVEAAYSAEELRATPVARSTPDLWTLTERARASFDSRRSGDIVVLLRRYVTPIRDTKGSVATHGSPWDYDRRVPILFWRAGMARSDRDQPIETVDIMPTLAALLGMPVRNADVDGKCLLGVEGVNCPSR